MQLVGLEVAAGYVILYVSQFQLVTILKIASDYLRSLTTIFIYTFSLWCLYPAEFALFWPVLYFQHCNIYKKSSSFLSTFNFHNKCQKILTFCKYLFFVNSLPATILQIANMLSFRYSLYNILCISWFLLNFAVELIAILYCEC